MADAGRKLQECLDKVRKGTKKKSLTINCKKTIHFSDFMIIHWFNPLPIFFLITFLLVYSLTFSLLVSLSVIYHSISTSGFPQVYIVFGNLSGITKKYFFGPITYYIFFKVRGARIYTLLSGRTYPKEPSYRFWNSFRTPPDMTHIEMRQKPSVKE